MKLVITDQAVRFVDGERVAGRYVLDDPFKPYIHPLHTPAGHMVSLAMPHDHPHHKGLMYALRTSQVNFWEERSTLPGEIVGRQIHRQFDELTESGQRVGFVELLHWETEAGDVLFHERRSISAHRDADGKSYVWTWNAELDPLVDVRLIKSQWSIPDGDGNPINYHGLGIRLSREFGCTGNNELVLDGAPAAFGAALGFQPQAATFQGSIDGHPVAPRAAVCIRQASQHGLFVLEHPFAFMAFGPSNLAEITLDAHATLRESFVVEVSDL